MPEERYRHIFLSGPNQTQRFTNPRRGGSLFPIKDRNRGEHSYYLQQRIEEAWRAANERRSVSLVEKYGTYIEFISEPGFDLIVQSLEARHSGIRLLNVRKEGNEGNVSTHATVYVPHDKRGYFLRKIQAYATENDRRSEQPKNIKLINNLKDIRLAVLESFWRSEDLLLIPRENPEWSEVWISSNEDSVVSRFEASLRILRIESKTGLLKFPERSVKLIFANRNQLEQLIETSDDVAELRAAKEIATFFIAMSNQEQIVQLQDLIRRTNFNRNTDVAICILDTGVNNGHPLIRPILDNTDRHTINQAWGVNDETVGPNSGHGTLMAGMAAYGDLLSALNGNDSVRIDHRIESAKILPPHPVQNQKDLWGYITAQGISRAEIQASHRKRIICMAITSPDSRDRGKPSSWSANIDALSSGFEDATHRLIVLSAGNIDDPNSWCNYPNDNLTNEIHDPAQAWNALTVGAFTEKTRIIDPTLSTYTPIAPSGGLSPFSTTSVTWPDRKWPIKPEVLFEGGNAARAPNNSALNIDDLQLLSTNHDILTAQFAIFSGTSAACAQAAQMAAQIQAQYTDAWPETVRGLIVHTAEWTDAMRRQFLQTQSPTRGEFAKLLRICGYGVPNLNRALYCTSNSLTLISQAQLHPFDYDEQKHRYVTRDMHLYNLPWPRDVLSDLGGREVNMRVTLSYFIEPAPGEVGWDARYRYASHALRFEVNGPTESEMQFVQRINNQARDDGEHPGTQGPRDKWLIGNARNVGSIHSDIWQGTAADLAESHLIAVYPTVGWWRERHHLEQWNRQARYALIVSIYTKEQNIDIYTPVAAQIRTSVPIEIPVNRRAH